IVSEVRIIRRESMLISAIVSSRTSGRWRAGMDPDMGRRKCLAVLGGSLVWPLATRAQQSPVPTIGYLHAGSPNVNFEAAFGKGLSELGFVAGQNVAIEFRYAEDQNDRLPPLAAELVRRRVAVIFASGGVVAVPAAKAATTTIPIVFTTGADPV